MIAEVSTTQRTIQASRRGMPKTSGVARLTKKTPPRMPRNGRAARRWMSFMAAGGRSGLRGRERPLLPQKHRAPGEFPPPRWARKGLAFRLGGAAALAAPAPLLLPLLRLRRVGPLALRPARAHRHRRAERMVFDHGDLLPRQLLDVAQIGPHLGLAEGERDALG